jgi:multiple sugar transport system permease protein
MTWRRRSEQILGRDWREAYIFALPMLLLLFGLIAYPYLSAFHMSFYNVTGVQWGEFRGLNNYIDQWNDRVFRESFAITVQFTVYSVFFKFIVGLIAAMLLHNIGRWQIFLAPLVLLPFVVPEVVTALVWRFLFDPTFGGLNTILRTAHDLTGGAIGTSLGYPWTGTATWALWSMVLVNVWKGVPFFALLTLAGLKAIDNDLYDAAAVDGANAWQRFLHITLPGLRYVIIVATLFSTISTFNTFGLIYLITGGGPMGATRVYAVLAYERIGGLRYSQGVAVALTMAPILLVAIAILGRYMRAGQKGDTGQSGPVWNALMFVLWPLRMVIRLFIKLLWAINDVLEVTFGAISRGINQIITGGNPNRQGQSRKIGRAAGRTGIGLGMFVVLFFSLFPFYFVITTAFKEAAQIRGFRSPFWPDPWSLVNFNELLYRTNFLTWMGNTIQVALVAMLVGVLASALGAYALVRLRWRGAGFFSTVILITYLMPTIMLVVPLYQVFAQLRLVNSLASLMIAYPAFLMPFAAWLLMGYYRSIPEELEDAAMIDGCNRFQAFFRIVLPLVAPALVAVAILAITQAWNEFLLAFIFISRDSATTLPIGLGRMVIGDVFPWGLLMSASVLMAIPVVILYMLGQKFLVGGLAAGAVKG